MLTHNGNQTELSEKQTPVSYKYLKQGENMAVCWRSRVLSMLYVLGVFTCFTY